MSHSATNLTQRKPRCPFCSFTRFWRLRRDRRKCKRCRREWSPRRPLCQGFRATESQWRTFLEVFLEERRSVRIAERLRLERRTVHRMAAVVRGVMADDPPARFSGTVEIDETYIGGQWRNQPWSVRRQGTKRGHGTSKQGILGILHRRSRRVAAVLVSDLKARTLLPIVADQVAARSTVYTDGYGIYVPLGRRYRHRSVNHAEGEYVRGRVHTNGIESFWGYLKRRLKTTGGIRRERLRLYVAEEVWRFNHRHQTLEEHVNILVSLLVARK